MCDRTFPICEIHLSFDGGICCAPDRRINSSLLWCDSLYNCQIGTPDLTLFHLGRENCCTIRIFRQDQGSCGVSVQTVDAAVDEMLSFFFKIPGNSISQCIIIISNGRVHRHVCRLIYD